MITTEQQQNAIRYGISLGEKLETIADLPKLWEEIGSKRKVGIHLKKVGAHPFLKGVSHNVVIFAVGHALQNIMTPQAYLKISKKNARKGQKEGREKSKENKTGRYSSTTQSYLAKKSAIARGQTLWEHYEINSAYFLKEKLKFTYAEIANKLNIIYHSNNNTRNKGRVSEMFRRKNNKIKNYKKNIEELLKAS